MRVEQNPDGSYGKRLTDVEQKIIKMIYKEQGDRTNADNALQSQINKLVSDNIQMAADLSALKMKAGALQVQVDADAANILTLQDQVANLMKDVATLKAK